MKTLTQTLQESLFDHTHKQYKERMMDAREKLVGKQFYPLKIEDITDSRILIGHAVKSNHDMWLNNTCVDWLLDEVWKILGTKLNHIFTLSNIQNVWIDDDVDFQKTMWEFDGDFIIKPSTTLQNLDLKCKCVYYNGNGGKVTLENCTFLCTERAPKVFFGNSLPEISQKNTKLIIKKQSPKTFSFSLK